jgi:hypothetical protein
MSKLTTFFLLVRSNGFNIFIPDQQSAGFCDYGFYPSWLWGFHSSALSSIIDEVGKL